jgi:hypothetical protein
MISKNEQQALKKMLEKHLSEVEQMQKEKSHSDAYIIGYLIGTIKGTIQWLND